MNTRRWTRGTIVVVLLAWIGAVVGAGPAHAAKPEDLVEKARLSFETMVQDPDFKYIHNHLRHAKAVLIFPMMLKGAFIIGASGGSGVLLVRDQTTGEWGQPAFYTLGGLSFGLQFGGHASEVILLVMTRKGVDSLYSSSIKLGADATVAAGPVGVGVEGATPASFSADFVSFARAKGAYIGVSLEGAFIAARHDYNKAYYNHPVRPVDILVVKSVSNPQADGLRQAVAAATRWP